MDSIPILCAVMLLCSSSAFAKGSTPPRAPALVPAPAPAPVMANITHLLEVTGPFNIFLDHLRSTGVLDTFQNQANTSQGITIFAPSNDAFNSLKPRALSGLKPEQLKNLLLFHAIPRYLALSDFENLTRSAPAQTFVGEPAFALNFTDAAGEIRVHSGQSSPKVSSSVYTTPPVALYEVDRVLLPTAIFGNEEPLAPAAAPSPSPLLSPKRSPAAVAGSPSPLTSSSASAPSSSPSSAPSSSSPDSSSPSAFRRSAVGWGVEVLCLVLVMLLFL